MGTKAPGDPKHETRSMAAAVCFVLGLVALVAFFGAGEGLDPVSVFALGWVSGALLTTAVWIVLRSIHKQKGGTRPTRFDPSVPHPYDRARYF